MRQVFSSLLANAIDAVEPGGKIQVSVEQSQLKDSRAAVALVVRDNGSGIADRDRSKLFRPFFKGESGTGLGLWIVNGIVSKHGGGIDVSSNSDGSRGTTFKVILPKGGGPSSCLADALN